jgi:RecB family endonuclease NucS
MTRSSTYSVLRARCFKPITKELRTEYGMIDLYGVDKQGNVVVIEFKRRSKRVEEVEEKKLSEEKLPPLPT